MRRPLLIAIPVLALMLLAGSPFLSIQLSTGQNLEDLPDTPAREGFLTIVNEFPGGESDPVTVAVTWDGLDLEADGMAPDVQEDLAAYLDEVAALDDVNGVESVLDAPTGLPAEQYRALLAIPAAERPAEVAAGLDRYLDDWIGGDTAKVRVFSGLLPDSDDGRALVDDVREVSPPDGAEAITAGLPSRSRDFMTSFYASVPMAVLIVVAVTGGILFLTFGSVFLPVKAVLMSLISVSASFGALVWIFQQGHLSSVLGFDPSGATAAWLPIIMFAILFGLSMDYEVFLLARVKEFRDAGFGLGAMDADGDFVVVDVDEGGIGTVELADEDHLDPGGARRPLDVGDVPETGGCGGEGGGLRSDREVGARRGRNQQESDEGAHESTLSRFPESAALARFAPAETFALARR